MIGKERPTWEHLLQECQRLEEIAGKIQPTFFSNTPVNSNLPTDKIEQLTADYYSWYGECLSVLQDDLKEKFRIAYDGGNVSPHVGIQRFLEADTYISRCFFDTAIHFLGHHHTTRSWCASSLPGDV